MPKIIGGMVGWVLSWIMKAGFKWTFTKEHGLDLRNRIRAWWWAYHQGAVPGSRREAVAEVVQETFQFKHSPDGTKVIANGDAAVVSDLQNALERLKSHDQTDVDFAKVHIGNAILRLGGKAE